jgi:hypothetical protein
MVTDRIDERWTCDLVTFLFTRYRVRGARSSAG